MDNLIRIENLVNAEIQDAIENFVTSTAFRWYYSPGTIVLEELDEESKKFEHIKSGWIIYFIQLQELDL